MSALNKLRSIEVQVTREFSGADPVWTNATIHTITDGTTSVTIPVLGETEYAVRARTQDVYGQFSSWSTHTTHTTAVGADSQGVSNASATVTVEADGLHVRDGAIFIEDISGASALNAAGFSGSWLDFIGSGGIYNAYFTAGLTTDIPVTEVGTGSTLADYDASAVQALLPYWVVAASGGTVKIVTDSGAPSGRALEVSGSSSQVNRVYQDIPFNTADNGLTIQIMLSVTSVFSVAGDEFTVYASFRDANHALLESRVAVYEATGPFPLNDFGPVIRFTTDQSLPFLAPAEARYVRVELETVHATTSSALRVGALSINPSSIYYQVSEAAVATADTAYVFDTLYLAADDAYQLWGAGGDIEMRRTGAGQLTFSGASSGTMSGGVIIKGQLILDDSGEGTNEGGQLGLLGEGSNLDWNIDNYAGRVRMHAAGSVFFDLNQNRLALFGGTNTSVTTPQLAVNVTASAGSDQAVVEWQVGGIRRGSVRADDQGNMVVSGAVSGSTYLAWDAGTGGVVFGDGASGEVGRITSTGLVRGFGGTSFPASPSNNDRYYRTDLDMEFFYDGTRWLSTALYETQYDFLQNLAATSNDNCRASTPDLRGGSDIYIVNAALTAFNVTAGTALSASHKWVLTYKKLAVTSGALTTIATINIDSGASATWRQATPVAVNALLNNGTAMALLTLTATKTGTPGNLYVYPAITYRIVAT